LKYIDGFIEKRKQITELYRDLLKDTRGISILEEMEGVKQAYSYFPVLVDEEQYGMSRDDLYEKLKAHNIFGRRYFYPLISDFEPYRNLPSARPEELPVATQIAKQVLCLPIYADLEVSEVERIGSVIKSEE